jgi:hypothetical protein
MATQIVIANKESITIDDTYIINWADRGNALTVPDTVHFIIWNNLTGQNEVQSKDPSTGNMTGNVSLNATSDVVYGSTTVADLLTWAETRKGQIETAKTAYDNAVAADNAAGNNGEQYWEKSWIDFDSNYS